MNNENFCSKFNVSIASSVSDPAYRCLRLSEALPSLDILWLSFRRHDPIVYSTYSSAAHNKHVDTA